MKSDLHTSLEQVTSRKDQEQYWMRSEPYRFIPVKEFSDMYKKFHTGSQMLEDLKVPFPKEKSHKAALVTKKYTVSRGELFKTVFAKEWLLFKRNKIVTIFKTMQVSNSHHQINSSLNPTDQPLTNYSSSTRILPCRKITWGLDFDLY